MNGNDLVDTKASSEGWEKEAITQPSKEEWYGTKYSIGQKPDFDSFKNFFEEEEWSDVCKSLTKPPKNRFIPDVPHGLRIISRST